jgi:CDGSH-type Zn-finger protein
MTIRITVRRNGPLEIAPDDVPNIELVDHEGNVIPPRAAAGKPMKLCRCGASPVKPFCDGTHSRIGFVGAEAARAVHDASEQASPATTQGDGSPAGEQTSNPPTSSPQ